MVQPDSPEGEDETGTAEDTPKDSNTAAGANPPGSNPAASKPPSNDDTSSFASSGV